MKSMGGMMKDLKLVRKITMVSLLELSFVVNADNLMYLPSMMSRKSQLMPAV